jgi:ABC-type phosphate transport system substrate-binding protein
MHLILFPDYATIPAINYHPAVTQTKKDGATMRNSLAIAVIGAIMFANVVQAEDVIKYDGSSQIYHAMIKDSADAFTKESNGKVEGRDGKTDDAVPSLIAGKCNVGGIARPSRGFARSTDPDDRSRASQGL